MIRTPLLIHTIGKVGSKTIEQACQRLKQYDVAHTHCLGPALDELVERWHRDYGGTTPHMRHGLRVRREVLEAGRPFKLITATRDPLARNVSAFFQNLERHGFGKSEIDAANGTVDPLNDMVATFMRNYPHSHPARWFDEEIRDVLGLDLLAEPFDPEVGHATYSIGASSVLVLQVELPDERKEAVLRDFLDAPDLRLEATNVGSQKRYAKAYQRFRAGIAFDAEFLDEIYGSRYARHFYSAQQLEGFRAHWRVHGATGQNSVPG